MAVAAYTARSTASTRDKNTVCPVRKYNEHKTSIYKQFKIATNEKNGINTNVNNQWR